MVPRLTVTLPRLAVANQRFSRPRVDISDQHFALDCGQRLFAEVGFEMQPNDATVGA